MSNFTKGEWQIYPHVVRASFKVLATIRVPNSDIANIAYVPVIHGFPEHEAQANVRLIAEAPVMYDLLNKAFHILGKNAANDAICREIDECLSRVDGAPVQSEEGKQQ